MANINPPFVINLLHFSLIGSKAKNLWKFIHFGDWKLSDIMLILYIVWFLETLPFLSILRGMSPGPACLRLWVSNIFLNVQNAKGKLNVNESLKMYSVNLSVITECKWKGGGGRASLSSNHGDFISPPFSSSSSSIYQQIASFEYLMFIIFKCRSSLSWKRRIMELERTPLTLSLKLSPPSDMSVFFSLSFFSPPSDMWMQITSIINNRLLTVLFDQTFGDSHIRVVLRCCSGGWLALSTRSSRGRSSNKLLAFRSRTSSSKTMPLRWGLVFLKIGQLRLKPFQSGGTLMFWAVMGFFYFLLNIL